MSLLRDRLLNFYELLLDHYGPQRWWPAQTATETIIGCILVQHTNWLNVERAIANLTRSDLLDFSAINKTEPAQLATIIRPAGTPQIKAKRLRAFSLWLEERYDFDLNRLLEEQLQDLRADLMGISGIGPETADCILLYAAKKPTFVADTYTHRIMTRHLLASQDWGYEKLKGLFETHLPADTQLYNEYHALLVQVGKQHCRKTPSCRNCPLEELDHRT